MSGLEVTAAAYVDRCSIDYAICTDEVEFRLADRHEIFHLTATETGLEALARSSNAALLELRLRARQEQEPHEPRSPRERQESCRADCGGHDRCAPRAPR
ncbi:hypothetical protein [Salinifilum ghardaiensis]